MNRGIGCSPARTFRLRSYSEERLVETVESNLSCLLRILRFNVEHGIFFFRVTSDLVPFASHPVCTFPWQTHFAERLKQIGGFIKRHRIRISMHPDQFTLINSLDKAIFRSSVRELIYHNQVLDLMALGPSAKIQIHVGGVYGDKAGSMKRFVDRYRTLDPGIRKRLVIENDDRSYGVADCLRIHGDTGVPILLDVLHHRVRNQSESLRDVIEQAQGTWRRRDGLPMMDYSAQKPGGKPGQHAETVDLRHFRRFVQETKPFDFDLMLEIKDKERSALRAVDALSHDARLYRST